MRKKKYYDFSNRIDLDLVMRHFLASSKKSYC